MAERRCLSKKIVESDAFYHLPPISQAIYVHLCMIADDDGFVNCSDPVTMMFRSGAVHVKKLLDSRFLLKYNDVIVVKHWRVMNSLKNDRAKPLQYPEVAKHIWIKENRSYTDHPVDGCKTLFEVKTGIQMESKWNPNGIPTEPNRIEPNLTEPNRSKPADAEGWFRDIFESYPTERRGDADCVRVAFQDAVHSVEDYRIMRDNLQGWIKSEQWTKDDGQYIPFLANWIARGTWKTVPAVRPDIGKYNGGFQGYQQYSDDAVDAIRRQMEEE